MYNAVDISRYVVNMCTEENRPVTNLKLQKLMYYIWIDYYKKTGEFLFNNDICAWPLGPVVPDVYDEFCAYGGLPIQKRYDSNILCGVVKSVISASLDTWGQYSASTLVDMTHMQGKPWEKIYDQGRGRSKIIPFELIVECECN